MGQSEDGLAEIAVYKGVVPEGATRDDLDAVAETVVGLTVTAQPQQHKDEVFTFKVESQGAGKSRTTAATRTTENRR